MLVSIVVPTYNEKENIAELIRRARSACSSAGLDFEIIVADDMSPDGTADAAGEALSGCKGAVLRRTGPRGLAPAVTEGFEAARGDVLCVIDADLSHPPEAIPALARAIGDGADLAVGSRHVEGGGVEGWPLRRRLASRLACLLARPLTGIRDATSGFFIIRKAAIEGVALNPRGFKIGLEVFVKAASRKYVEVPYVFRDRVKGSSKLGSRVMAQYLLQLVRLFLWKTARIFEFTRPSRKAGV